MFFVLKFFCQYLVTDVIQLAGYIGWGKYHKSGLEANFGGNLVICPEAPERLTNPTVRNMIEEDIF